MNTVLFVDDESNVLDGLRRMLRPMRDQWNMQFVDSGEKALAYLATAPCDVVVTDMRMPGMNGAQLLTEVMRLYPETVRIILSGHSDRDMTLTAIGCTHQFLMKPCSAEILTSTVLRACALRDKLSVPALKHLTSRLIGLPSLPTIYHDVVSEINSPDGSIARLGKIIAGDVAMTAKILQLVNSSFFGTVRRVTTPVEAVRSLGFDTIKSLVLSVGIFSQFKELQVPGFTLQTMTDHSLEAATLAKRIVQCETSDKECIENAFMAGMLHDVGQLVFLSSTPGQYAQVIASGNEQRIPLFEVERQMLGATHADVGAYLLELWGLPQAIVEATAFHHCPDKCPTSGFSVLTAVHVADVWDHEHHPEAPGAIDSQLDQAYLDRLGLGRRLEAWREVCEASPAGGISA